MLKHFYRNPEILTYDFGPRHPLKPERLLRTYALLEHYVGGLPNDARIATTQDLSRVHDEEYIENTRLIDVAIAEGEDRDENVLEMRTSHGYWGDNPPFAGMTKAAAAYTGASAMAAEAVRNGAPMAFSIGGGLHHAMRSKASGFCIFNDCAIACSILRDRFEKVAYVDIDVHHGDGVQWIFYEDPTVLTCSIHESGKSLWPGTGGVEETGVDFTAVNVPVYQGTGPEGWLEEFRRGILPPLERWKPQAIVLQMGTDTHRLDPLAHINSNQQAWLEAVKDVKALGLPLVALGGGGYNLTTVPRMWASAILTLAGIPYDDEIPPHLAEVVGATTFSD